MASRRLKVKFPSVDAYLLGSAIESADTIVPVSSEQRLFTVLEAASDRDRDAVKRAARTLEKEYGASIVEDYQYAIDPDEIDGVMAEGSLDDVVNQTNARDAWKMGYTGKGAAIAVVDTGIDDTKLRIAGKSVGGWAPPGRDPWTDWDGHGSMCACIAVGTKQYGGVFNGIAPDASVIPCRTRFYDSELAIIYDYLRNLKNEKGLTIVASNSFGIPTGSAPQPIPGADFPDALSDAIKAGVFVVFSAGNNHSRAGGQPSQCNPNSIWLHKSRADVMTVATCDLDEDMWYYSSRGPGQYFGQQNTSRKPDVTAPTPRNGRVVYGNRVRVLPDGWGTSGACPQVAGLAALLIECSPGLDRASLFGAIQNGATPINVGYNCEGHGRIDCVASLNLVTN